jgi:hypothetical protein
LAKLKKKISPHPILSNIKHTIQAITMPFMAHDITFLSNNNAYISLANKDDPFSNRSPTTQSNTKEAPNAPKRTEKALNETSKNETSAYKKQQKIKYRRRK